MSRRSFHIVALGASAGGHPALREFFNNIPANPGVAFVVVTHLLRDKVSILDTILSRHTTLPVIRLKGVDLVRPDHIYVLPENAKVVLRNGCLSLHPREEDEIINKTIDYFLQSLADEQQDKAIGIIFSGMGTDGAKGAETISENGGVMLVQDPRTTQFDSMPKATIAQDDPIAILPPNELARKVMELVSEKVKSTHS